MDCGAGGWLFVELQDEEGRALEGYTLKTCETITANDIRVRVAWHGPGGRIAVESRTVRLRVVMRSAKLYSFQFTSRA